MIIEKTTINGWKGDTTYSLDLSAPDEDFVFEIKLKSGTLKIYPDRLCSGMHLDQIMVNCKNGFSITEVSHKHGDFVSVVMEKPMNIEEI